MIFKSNTRNNAVTQLCIELTRSFAVLNRQNENEMEYIICEKLWSFWYMQNRERIWKEYNDIYCELLEQLRVKRSTPISDDEIYKLYTDFLNIETGIVFNMQKQYIKALKQLYNHLKKAGLSTKTPLKTIIKNARKTHN